MNPFFIKKIIIEIKNLTGEVEKKMRGCSTWREIDVRVEGEKKKEIERLITWKKCIWYTIAIKKINLFIILYRKSV